VIAFLLSLNAVLALTAGAAVLVARAKSKKLERAEDSIGRIRERVERLDKAVEQNKKITEGANAQRSELAETNDENLVNRANNLFSR